MTTKDKIINKGTSDLYGFWIVVSGPETLTINQMREITGLGHTAVRSRLRKLEEISVVQLILTKGSSGKLMGNRWVFSEIYNETGK